MSSPVPRHVAIIMDGNGRWARRRGLPRTEGHRQGVKATRRAVEAAGEFGIEYLTIYAFSAENWSRPPEEIRSLVDLLHQWLPREVDSLDRNGIRLRVIGDLSRFPRETQALIEGACMRTARHSQRHLVIALNYGSRQEVVEAFRRYGDAVRAGREDPAACDYATVARHLSTDGIPDPDLVIRTSGEHRMSNFLLLQAAYAEWYFTPVLWPDFDRSVFVEALDAYAARERRFGRTSEQLPAAFPAARS